MKYFDFVISEVQYIPLQYPIGSSMPFLKAEVLLWWERNLAWVQGISENSQTKIFQAFSKELKTLQPNTSQLIDCACFTPNRERPEHIMEMKEALRAQGEIHYSLQFCTPFEAFLETLS